MSERKKIPAYERFWKHVNMHGPISKLGTRCWIWTAGKFKSGYGEFNPTHGHPVTAHKFSWEQKHRRKVGDGFELHHRCEVRLCIRPTHLERVTRQTHPDDITVVNRMKTHCSNGHALIPQNILNRNRPGRECKICHRDREYRRNHGGTENASLRNGLGFRNG